MVKYGYDDSMLETTSSNTNCCRVVVQLVQNGEIHVRRTVDYSYGGRVAVASKGARIVNIVELVKKHKYIRLTSANIIYVQKGLPIVASRLDLLANLRERFFRHGV